MSEELQLSKKFTAPSILLYALPTIFTMVFMSLYMIIDGIFVARYVDEYAFSAINVVYPIISVVLAIGLMLAMGSSAIIGKLLGEGKDAQAREFFSQIYVVGILLGGLFSLCSILWCNPLLHLLQATELLFPYAKSYLIYTALFFIPSILQVYAQSFFVTNGKPMLGFTICFLGGLTNIFLDYLFIAVLQWGIKGAALATGIGYCVPGLFALLYFLCNRHSPLRFVPFHWNLAALLETCSNGISEFVTNTSVSITTFLFNVILLKMVGESGVASITAILYIQMFQMGLYMGFALGIAPLISYKYGAKSTNELTLIMKVSFITIAFFSLLVISFSYLCGEFAMELFIPRESETYDMAMKGLYLYSISYIFMGVNVFVSALFTALSNGKISGTLSCTRNLLFIVVCLLTLPRVWGLTGVWLAVPIAESLAFIMSLYFFHKYKKHYNYG